ncbi:hypothetical protein J8273_5000 [Carpediemonas membranifera]|uniref:Uncharacterized protein n=1 Tax=Carpediemonas membranifera TaxID=201153 RepID=A0A8J6B3I0_9EUKA|nr:hypothetical protein J8273_5000 [Carpediemonas membranifera]|eukprot:KAG9393514.1 hypothetical protein J8273_5000 [Carpediemonas membranifera]
MLTISFVHFMQAMGSTELHIQQLIAAVEVCRGPNISDRCERQARKLSRVISGEFDNAFVRYLRELYKDDEYVLQELDAIEGIIYQSNIPQSPLVAELQADPDSKPTARQRRAAHRAQIKSTPPVVKTRLKAAKERRLLSDPKPTNLTSTEATGLTKWVESLETHGDDTLVASDFAGINGFGASRAQLEGLEISFGSGNVRVMRSWIAYQLCLYDWISKVVEFGRDEVPVDALRTAAIHQRQLFTDANKVDANATRIQIVKTPFYNAVMQRVIGMGESESMMRHYHNIIGVILLHYEDFPILIQRQLIPSDTDAVKGLSSLIIHCHLCTTYNLVKDIRPEIESALDGKVPRAVMPFARKAFGLTANYHVEQLSDEPITPEVEPAKKGKKQKYSLNVRAIAKTSGCDPSEIEEAKRARTK